MVNNYDWLSQLDLISFLRDVGKHFPMSVMLSRESVRRRLDSDAGLSFTEFTYQALQAYDFYHLYQHHNCRLQVGGSDQYGNILAGIDYVRRMTGADDRAAALVYPLLTTASGEKMGQTARGAVWLDADRTSPFEWYQYWFNADDADIGAYLRTLTLIELDEIATIEARAQADPAARIGQRALAAELTRMLHGAEAADAAERDSRQVFDSGADPAALSGDVPSAEVTRADLDKGLSLTRMLVQTGLAASNGEAKRLVRQGGVSIDGRRVEPTERTIDADLFAATDAVLLAAGPRRRALLRVVN